MEADQLQRLTHDCSYTFARATKAVSLVPPAYYADLACERARCYLAAFLTGHDGATATSGDESKIFGKALEDWNGGPVKNYVRDTMFYV